MIHDETVQREDRKAQKTRQRHLEQLVSLQARDRVDPPGPGEGVERLPRQPHRRSRGEDLDDPLISAVLEVGQQGPLGSVTVVPRLQDEGQEPPDEREEEARLPQRQEEERESRTHERGGMPTQGQRGTHPTSGNAQSLGPAVGEVDRRQDGREGREGGEHPRRTAVGGKHVVPVGEAKIHELEEEPEGRRPEQKADGEARRRRPPTRDGRVAGAERNQGRVPGPVVVPAEKRLHAPGGRERREGKDGNGHHEEHHRLSEDARVPSEPAAVDEAA